MVGGLPLSVSRVAPRRKAPAGTSTGSVGAAVHTWQPGSKHEHLRAAVLHTGHPRKKQEQVAAEQIRHEGNKQVHFLEPAIGWRPLRQTVVLWMVDVG